MTHPPRAASFDVVVPRMVTAVYVSLTVFVVMMAVSRSPLDFELNVTGQLAVLLLLLATGLGVTGFQHRRSE